MSETVKKNMKAVSKVVKKNNLGQNAFATAWDICTIGSVYAMRHISSYNLNNFAITLASCLDDDELEMVEMYNEKIERRTKLITGIDVGIRIAMRVAMAIKGTNPKVRKNCMLASFITTAIGVAADMYFTLDDHTKLWSKLNSALTDILEEKERELEHMESELESQMKKATFLSGKKESIISDINEQREMIDYIIIQKKSALKSKNNHLVLLLLSRLTSCVDIANMCNYRSKK